jgi:hypothetical protein
MTTYRYNLKDAIAAATYVSENNPNNFSFQHVWNTMMEMLRTVTDETSYVATMGFFIIVEDKNIKPSGIEYDVSFLVEPSFDNGSDSYQVGTLEVY